MAAPESNIVTVDLRTQVPVGWTLTGLSEPRFDGVNFYRVALSDTSALAFSLSKPRFVQVEYQVYSQSQDIIVNLRAGDQVIQRKKFKAGVFEDVEPAGSFFPAGKNTILWEYICSPKPCKTSINQYWTRVHTISPSHEKAIETVGPHTAKQFLYAPETQLKVFGVGPVHYDGSNFIQKIVDKNIRLSWPEGKTLNASLYIYSTQNFRVTTMIRGRIVSDQKGGKSGGIDVGTSLIAHPEARFLDLKVECLDGTLNYGCAYLYDPQITIDTAPTVGVPVILVSCLAVISMCLILWRFLFLRH